MPTVTAVGQYFVGAYSHTYTHLHRHKHTITFETGYVTLTNNNNAQIKIIIMKVIKFIFKLKVCKSKHVIGKVV